MYLFRFFSAKDSQKLVRNIFEGKKRGNKLNCVEEVIKTDTSGKAKSQHIGGENDVYVLRVEDVN